MKKTINSLLAIGLVAIFVLGACAPVAQTEPAAVVPTEPAAVAPTEPVAVVPTEPAAVAPTEPAAVSLTDAEMEALIAEKAHDKHTLEFILSINKTADEWSATLDKMISYGAKISPEEKILIIDWLVSRNK